MSVPRPSRALRADASRNRRLALDAARELYALRGNALTMADVAARAGVGKATLYRTFPSREHLINAMASEYLENFRDRARAWAGKPDTGAALRDLLTGFPNALITGAVAALFDLQSASSDPSRLADLQRQAMAAFDEVLDQAKAQHVVRPEITSRHVTVLMSGIAKALPPDELHDPQVFAEYSELVLNAICV